MYVCVCLDAFVSVFLLVWHVQYVCVFQVEELTTENTQLRERVALLEKLLDIKKQDGQLFSKIVDHVSFSVLQLPYKVLEVVV